MKPNRKVLVLLLIGTILWAVSPIIRLIFNSILNDYTPEDYMYYVNFGLWLLIPISLSLCIISLLNGKLLLRKISGITLLAMTVVWLGMNIYYKMDFFDISWDRFYERNPVWYFVDEILTMIPTITLALLGIAVTWEKPRRLKKAGAWLLAGGTILLFSICSSLLEYCFSYGVHFTDPEDLFWLGLSLIEILFPVGMIALALQLLRHIDLPQSTLSDDLLDSPETPVASAPVTSVADWIGVFFLTLIPIAGFVLLAVWSATNDKKWRRNWALATFLWSVIVLVFQFFIYLPVLDLYDSDSPLYAAGGLIVAMIAAIGFFLIYNYRQRPDILDETTEPTASEWFGRVFLCALPLVGLICTIVWATDAERQERRTWAIARLIWMGVMVVMWLFIYTSMLQLKRYSGGLWDL